MYKIEKRNGTDSHKEGKNKYKEEPAGCNCKQDNAFYF